MILETLKRFGITTGAAAAAASKAAVLALLGKPQLTVTIPTPIGLRLEIPIENVFKKEDMFCATVKKFSGDNPDILNGIEIVSCVSLIDEQRIIIEGGKGVGIVKRQGMKVPVGNKAINPIPSRMIEEAIREVIRDKGVRVLIEVPNGENIAISTMNPEVGIEGGISILGTTGIEMPVSDEDYLEHIKCELNVIRSSSETIVISPGNTGASYSKAIYGNIVVKVGDRIGDTILQAIRAGFKRIILAGLPAKLIKVSIGILNTHNKYGDGRIETLTHACM
ncbi:MAG: cobalt-precorrin-5B (C(1))-methyltransferase CbiD, partial [Sulfolobales archaeon]